MATQRRSFKDIFYRPALIALTVGASLIIGLLSFGGLYAIWPSIGLASAAFGLSVAYEGEIYYQNIKSALKKLLNRQHPEEELARDFLLKYFPKEDESWPDFFIDYETTLTLLHSLEHPSGTNRLDAATRKRKQELEATLTALEEEFYSVINTRATNHPPTETPEQIRRKQQLRNYLEHHPLNKGKLGKTTQSVLELYQRQLPGKRNIHLAARVFSLLSAVFMSIGTTYLLVEVFALVPFLVAIPVAIVPVLIIPMALISGIAFGILTYNNVAAMLTDSTLVHNAKQLLHDFKTKGFTARNMLFALTSAVLFSLAVGLTICTFGTWLTIIRETRPLFNWMSKIPLALLAFSTALFNSLAALVFNIENSSESLNMLNTLSQTNPLAQAWTHLKKQFAALQANENILQQLNPFRLVLFLTITPLRICFFLGHLISIGVTADRVPGVSKFFSALLGIISEFFEDLHYFVEVPHAHDRKTLLKERLSSGAGHTHQEDLPKRLLLLITYPLRLLSDAWHRVFGQFNPLPPAPATQDTTPIKPKLVLIDPTPNPNQSKPTPEAANTAPPTTPVKMPAPSTAPNTTGESSPNCDLESQCVDEACITRQHRRRVKTPYAFYPMNAQNGAFCSPCDSPFTSPATSVLNTEQHLAQTGQVVASQALR